MLTIERAREINEQVMGEISKELSNRNCECALLDTLCRMQQHYDIRATRYLWSRMSDNQRKLLLYFSDKPYKAVLFGPNCCR